jgi:hypothetical protein
MNQLSQIVSMKLNMLHLTVGNMIVRNLYNTLVIKIYCSRGLNRKAKFSEKLANTNCVSTCLNDAMIFYFFSRYLLLLAQPH